MFLYLPYSELLFGMDGIASYERYSLFLSGAGLAFLESPFQIAPPHYYLWFIIIIAFLFSMGIGKWITGLLLYISVLNLHMRNPLILDGSDNIILVTIPFLILANNYRLISYNIPMLKIENSGAFVYLRQLATAGFLLQICIVYFVTGAIKLGTDVWFNGTANYYILQLDEFKATRWNTILVQNEFFTKASTWFTLLFEILFPLAMLFKTTKYIWLFFGVLFHIGIWVLMKIDVFPWVMIATYFVFIDDAEYSAFSRRLKNMQVAKRIFKTSP